MKLHVTYLTILAFAIMTVAATSRQSVPKEVRAERFVVVDANGKETATLSMHEGGTWLTISGSEHPTGIALGCFRDGSVEFRATGVDGSARVSVNKSGYPTFHMNHLKQSVTIELAPDGEFGLLFEDQNGTDRAAMRLRDGNVVIEAFDATGTAKWRIPNSF